MELKLITEKVIKGLSVRTDTATEVAADKGEIASLWQTFDDMIAVDYQNGERVYGVYFDYESDHTGKFTVLAGYDGGSVPANAKLETIVIPQGEYLVFAHNGVMPQIAIDAWTEVWNYFTNASVEYQRLYSTDFEFYPSGNEIEVHIAVRAI